MARVRYRGVSLNKGTYEKLQRINEIRFEGRLSPAQLINYLADKALEALEAENGA